MITGLTKDWDFWELFVPQIFRGVGLMICMVPINNIALGTLPPERLKNASGLYNLTRNLGGAVGLALINTLLNDRLGPASPAPAREREWGSSHGGRDAQQSDAEVSRSRIRRVSRGAQDHVEHGAARGAGDVVRRRVPAADLPVRSPSSSRSRSIRKPARRRSPRAGRAH